MKSSYAVIVGTFDAIGHIALDLPNRRKAIEWVRKELMGLIKDGIKPVFEPATLGGGLVCFNDQTTAEVQKCYSVRVVRYAKNTIELGAGSHNVATWIVLDLGFPISFADDTRLVYELSHRKSHYYIPPILWNAGIQGMRDLTLSYDFDAATSGLGGTYFVSPRLYPNPAPWSEPLKRLPQKARLMLPKVAPLREKKVQHVEADVYRNLDYSHGSNKLVEKLAWELFPWRWSDDDAR